MKRRSFIKTAGLTALSACVSGPIGKVIPAQAAESRSPATGPLSGRRILTFNSVIRVNQIEVTRTRNEGFDEYDRGHSHPQLEPPGAHQSKANPPARPTLPAGGLAGK
jgi:hypothetical protein